MLIWGNKWKAGRRFVRMCVCKWVCEWVHQCLASHSVCTACFISCGTKNISVVRAFSPSPHSPSFSSEAHSQWHQLPPTHEQLLWQHTKTFLGVGGVAWLTHSNMRPTNPLTLRSIDICTARCSVCKAFKDIGWLHVWPFTWPGLFSALHYSLNHSHSQCILALSIVFLTVVLKLWDDSRNVQF